MLWAHIVALAIVWPLSADGPWEGLGGLVLAAALAALASLGLAGRTVRMAAATLGLLVSIATLALTLGVDSTRASAYAFLALAILALYQSWLPMLLLVGVLTADRAIASAAAFTAVAQAGAVASGWLQNEQLAYLLITAVVYHVAWRFSEHQTLYDPLTRLESRQLLGNGAEGKRGGGQERAGQAVLILDLDGFAMINQSLGHQAGDALLIAIANRLKGCLRRGDEIARHGGDEFVILLRQVSTQQQALQVAQRIHDSLREPFALDGHDVFLSASIGIALADGPSADHDRLLRGAALALARAKAEGKDRTVVFEPEMESGALARLELETDLHHAVERGEFTVYYQPILDLATEQLIGVEALVRWQHPRRGLVSPGEFIAHAESTGLIVPIGRFVLEVACRQVRQWRLEHWRHARLLLSVNLSAKHFDQPTLAEEIADVLARTGLPAGALQIEITESTMMRDRAASVRTLRSLKSLGVRLAMDDFGTGYSSLAYLARFPIDALKIDRSFIANLQDDPDSVAIVQAIIALAEALGLTVTAEGIETIRQLWCLRALGCHQGQGYLFARPMSADEFSALLMEVASFQGGMRGCAPC